MTDSELKYWLALKWVPGLGNVGFIALLEAFGSPQEVFEAPAARLQETTGMGTKVAAQIKAFNRWAEVERELSLSHKLQVSILTCRDDIYPQNLLNIYDFPPFIYVKGSLRPEDICIAVVGSRMASTYGRFSTERLCRELVMKGITVVSGLARGIDTAAHQGSLAAKGRTIAVLGCGLDIVYPPENKALFELIPLQGAIITEFPFGTPPQATNFPTRNRIISGLSLGVVVVEANYRSGSLITARVALEQGREVFAVPGSIDSDGSKGTNKLIKEGAKLIEGADDILEEILPQIGRKPAPFFAGKADQLQANTVDKRAIQPSEPYPQALTEGQAKLMKGLATTPVSVDQLIAFTGEKAGDVLNNLLLLELQGLICQLPGKMYALKEK